MSSIREWVRIGEPGRNDKFLSSFSERKMKNKGENKYQFHHFFHISTTSQTRARAEFR